MHRRAFGFRWIFKNKYFITTTILNNIVFSLPPLNKILGAPLCATGRPVGKTIARVADVERPAKSGRRSSRASRRKAPVAGDGDWRAKRLAALWCRRVREDVVRACAPRHQAHTAYNYYYTTLAAWHVVGVAASIARRAVGMWRGGVEGRAFLLLRVLRVVTVSRDVIYTLIVRL